MSEQPEPAGEIPEWTIGWRMQRALAHAGIAAGDMAADLQVSRATMSRWLNDKGMPPRSVYLDRVAELTGVPAFWLCHNDLDPCGPRAAVTDDLSLRRSEARSGSLRRRQINTRYSQAWTAA